MIRLTDEQKKILDKYLIEYAKFDEVNDLLDSINDTMLTFVDNNDEPLPQFIELENLYDSIYNSNQ